jgi:hypothetical protein
VLARKGGEGKRRCTFSVLKPNLSERKKSTAVGTNTVYPPISLFSSQTLVRQKLTPQVVANRLIDNANNSHLNTPFSSLYGIITANGFTGTATFPTALMTSGTLPVSEAVSLRTSEDGSCGSVSRIANSAYSAARNWDVSAM